MAEPSNEFADRVVVVTGASRGIGQAIAQTLAANGARVAIVDQEEAAVTAVAIEKAGGTSARWRGDVTDSHKLWDVNIGANVTSPVYDLASLRRVQIGTLPDMEEAEAVEAVRAAAAAWDRGQGTWPQMALSERIAAISPWAWEIKRSSTSSSWRAISSQYCRSCSTSAQWSSTMATGLII